MEGLSRVNGFVFVQFLPSFSNEIDLTEFIRLRISSKQQKYNPTNDDVRNAGYLNKKKKSNLFIDNRLIIRSDDKSFLNIVVKTKRGRNLKKNPRKRRAGGQKEHLDVTIQEHAKNLFYFYF